LHQVGDLFELNVKVRCQKVKDFGCQDGVSVLETVDNHSAMNSSDVMTIFLGCMVTELYAL